MDALATAKATEAALRKQLAEVTKQLGDKTAEHAKDAVNNAN